MNSSEIPQVSKVVVVTGGIGSGKTTVTKELERLGAVAVYADELAREVVAPGSAGLHSLIATFGDGILSEGGTLDRSKLASLIFASPQRRNELEQITHPLIAKLAASRIADAQRANAPLVVYDCPLFFEVGLQERGFGAIVLVDCEPELAVSRVMKRDSLSREQVMQRQKAQLPIEQKRSQADFIINNNSTLDELRSSVKALAPQLFAVANTD